MARVDVVVPTCRCDAGRTSVLAPPPPTRARHRTPACPAARSRPGPPLASSAVMGPPRRGAHSAPARFQTLPPSLRHLTPFALPAPPGPVRRRHGRPPGRAASEPRQIPHKGQAPSRSPTTWLVRGPTHGGCGGGPRQKRRGLPSVTRRVGTQPDVCRRVKRISSKSTSGRTTVVPLLCNWRPICTICAVVVVQSVARCTPNP